MSAFVYGRLTRDVARAQEPGMDAAAGGELKEKAAALAERISALVPADTLVLYAIIIASATETADDGTTTVTNPAVLKWSVPILAVLSIGLFLVGKLPKWEGPSDVVRALIPAAAFFAWSLLSGTNGVVLWEPLKGLSGGWEFLIAGPLAVLLLALTTRLNPTE